MNNILLIALMATTSLTATAVAQEYDPTWKSLENYEAPEWYEDAKLGFWVHWGVYSVPAYMGDHASEWYGRHMYRPDSPFFKHHKDRYGDPSKFGYKDFIPMFKAEKFDADAWADLCVEGGAKYFTMMGAHHDSFCMWDTQLSPWNSVAMGPKRDLVGELAKAIRKRGLKFGVSNHTAWNYQFFEFNHRHGFDAKDPANQDLYGAPDFDRETPPSDKERFTDPSQRDIDRWLDRTEELCDLYRPDLYYFDWGHGREEFEPGRKEFGAHYYNKAIQWGKGVYGNPGVVLNYKQNYYPAGSAVHDIERGRMNRIADMVWQTDDCVYDGHTWGYSQGVPIKPVNRIVDELVDIVSKRGVLMLSFAPKADGSFPADQKRLIRELGAWLKINGEAIYATRPFFTFSDGQTIRFTRNKNNDVLYAIMLKWEEEGRVTLQALNEKNMNAADIESVSLLGDRSLKWRLTDKGLSISLPNKPAYDYAFPIRIKVKGKLPEAPMDQANTKPHFNRLADTTAGQTAAVVSHTAP